MKLKPCPFCCGEATFYEFYESVDGRGDKLPKILCDCGVQLQLTYEEYHNIRVDFNYKGGYVSINKELLNAINQNVIDKWNRREPIEKIVEQLEAEVERARTHGLCINDRRSTMQGLLKVIKIVKSGGSV